MPRFESLEFSAIYGGEPLTIEVADEVIDRVLSIKGTIRLRGRPLRDFYSAAPDFWARNEQTGQAHYFEHTYDPATSEYRIFDIPPGEYGLSVDLDTNGDGWPLADDLDSWTILTLPEGQETVQQDIDLQTICYVPSTFRPIGLKYPPVRQGVFKNIPS